MSDARAAGRGAQGRVGSVINGKWKVDARIGSGGMATVYAATHRNGHRAAIKMLHAQLSRDPSTRARFLREGYVANAVGHPGVVTVEDDGVAEDGCAFLVLELLEGETIESRRLERGGALAIDEVLDIADQSLAALAAAHAKGIVHRDVKPENVFLTNDGRIKLLDFGLARMKDAQAEATKTGVTIGTPEFMPPEQAAGRRDAVDARSDVWALGATLFTTITGKYVHEASTLHEQLIASATQRARPIRQLAPHVPPPVAQVIDRALELEMNDRWQSAIEMAAALRDARGKVDDTFTADSLTVPVASVRPGSQPFSSPISSKPISSDKTIAMSGPPGQEPVISVKPEGFITARLSDVLEAPVSAPISAPPHSPPPRTARMSAPQPAAPPNAWSSSGDYPILGLQPQQQQHQQQPPPMTSESSGAMRVPSGQHPVIGPASASFAHAGPPPKSSSRVVLLVVALLLLVCGAVGGYVAWKARAGSPPSLVR